MSALTAEAAAGEAGEAEEAAAEVAEVAEAEVAEVAEVAEADCRPALAGKRPDPAENCWGATSPSGMSARARTSTARRPKS